MDAVKWIMRFLQGTFSMCLYFGSEKPTLVGFTDEDMAGNIDSRKSTSSYLISFLGELWLGNQDYRSVLHFLPPRQNLL